mgnify:CR=1 FL=1
METISQSAPGLSGAALVWRFYCTMTEALLLIGCVIALCTLMGRFLDRLAVPSLLIFIALGMCFGENGLLRIHFNDYYTVNLICSVSLIFIMFYGCLLYTSPSPRDCS